MLYITRVVVLILTIVLSIIVLGLAADLTSTTETYLHGAFTFASMGIASSVISLVTLPVLLIVDMLRTGAFTSMIVVELVWLFIVWVLWLTTAALTAQAGQEIPSNCNFVVAFFTTGCHELQAIEAFSFLNWILLMIYSIVVLVMAIIGSTRGHKTWTNSVKHAIFLGPAEGAVAPVPAQPVYTQSIVASQPLMQQHQYPPTNSSMQGHATAPTQGSYASQVHPQAPSQGSSQGPAYV